MFKSLQEKPYVRIYQFYTGNLNIPKFQYSFPLIVFFSILRFLKVFKWPILQGRDATGLTGFPVWPFLPHLYSFENP